VGSHPQLAGAMDSTPLAVPEAAIGLGASVAWHDGAAWAGAPGSGEVFVLDADGHWWTDVPESHLGDRLAVVGDGVLTGAWEDGSGSGAVHRLGAGHPGGSVDDGALRVVQVDEPVGIVLSDGPTEDSWLLGRPRAAANVGVVQLRTSDGEVTASWRGPSTGALLGGALATGDVDGDGLDDVILGAWGEAGFHGAIYLFTAPVSGGELADADARWEGDDWALAGYSLGVGDTDADGQNDVVVGSFGDTRAGSGAGAITVVPGNTPSGSLLDCDGHRLGPGSDAHLGTSLAVGDLDNDGHADVFAGAPDRHDGGVAALWYGPITGVADTADATLTFNQPGDQLGASVDLDPSRRRLLVGAPGAGDGQGAVHVIAAP